MMFTASMGRYAFWLSLVLLSTLPFWFSPLDLYVSRWFYQPACSPTGWLIDCYPLWHSVFFVGVMRVAWFMVLIPLLLLLWFHYRHQVAAKRRVWYFLLVFILGSGVLVNAVFKEHWGRPRPVQIEAFGGARSYAPPAAYVPERQGHSFPSGHVSVGFTFLALWFAWRRSRPTWARGALLFSLALSAAIAWTRLAAGGHFLSDVLWSGWLMWFTAWLLAYYLEPD